MKYFAAVDIMLFIHIDLMLMLLSTGGSTASEYSTLLTSEHNRYRRSEGAANMKKIVIMIFIYFKAMLKVLLLIRNSVWITR